MEDGLGSGGGDEGVGVGGELAVAVDDDEMARSFGCGDFRWSLSAEQRAAEQESQNGGAGAHQ